MKLEQSELTLKLEEMSETAAAFNRLYELVGILRSENGCPWDKVQTPLSMRRDLIEEVFEAVDAITAGDALHAKEELGDVLLNAVMVSYMHEQSGDFKVAECVNELCDKLVRRHPHVFSFSDGKVEMKGEVKNPDEVLKQWDRIKENVEGRKESSILDEVPIGFPPLLKAFKMQKKAAKKAFDWENAEDCFKKVREELEEVEKAKTPDEVEEEIGDLLFSVVNYARKMGVDPEVAMSRVNKKFYDRFTYVERKMKDAGLEMCKENFEKMDAFWDEAKRHSNG